MPVSGVDPSASTAAGCRPLARLSSPLRHDLREAVGLVDLFSAAVPERVAPGAGSFWDGDAARSVFLIADGVARAFRILPDGRRGVVGFLFAGDIVGLGFQERYPCSVEAITLLRVRRTERSRALRRAVADRAMHQKLMAHLGAQMDAVQDQVLLLTLKNAEERVASFILQVARRNGRQLDRLCTIDFPMSRIDIADYLGLTVETVCRTFSRLRAEGLITRAGRHAIVVERWQALADIASEPLRPRQATDRPHRLPTVAHARPTPPPDGPRPHGGA